MISARNLFLGATALIAAPAAFAQTAPTTTTPAPAQTAPAASATTTVVSDAEVQQFAAAALEVNKIQSDTSIAEADRTPRLQAALQTAGITPERFNAIGQQMQTDQALNKRIQAAAGATGGAAGQR